jgi:hypothetical protein
LTFLEFLAVFHRPNAVLNSQKAKNRMELGLANKVDGRLE